MRPQSGYFALEEGSAVLGGLSELMVKLKRLSTEVARESLGGTGTVETEDRTGVGVG